MGRRSQKRGHHQGRKSFLQRSPYPVLLKYFFSALAAEKYLVNLEPEVFANRLAHYLSEINAIHPFREGNGRVQRLFISQLAEQAGYTLDYSALDQAELYPVMQESFLGNIQPLAGLILKIID